MRAILNVVAFTSEHDRDILSNPRSISTVCTPVQLNTAVYLHQGAGLHLAFRSLDMTQDMGPLEKAEDTVKSALEREIISQLKQFPLQRSSIITLVHVTGVPYDELYSFLVYMVIEGKLARLEADYWGLPLSVPV